MTAADVSTRQWGWLDGDLVVDPEFDKVPVGCHASRAVPSRAKPRRAMTGRDVGQSSFGGSR